MVGEVFVNAQLFSSHRLSRKIAGKCTDTVALATRLMAGLQMERGTQQIEVSLSQQIADPPHLADAHPMEQEYALMKCVAFSPR